MAKQKQAQVETQASETNEKLTRWEAAYQAVKGLNSHEASLDDLAAKADKLFLDSNELDEDESDVEKASGQVQGILETLENLGLCELRWQCLVVPKVDLTAVRLNGKAK
jgi:hypothetical protein